MNRPLSGMLALLIFAAMGCAGLRKADASTQADARISFYESRVGGESSYPAYARLGAAYLQKGRESGRHEFFDKAAAALTTSLAYQRNHEALIWLSSVELARHRFPQALKLAEEALATMPDALDAQAAMFDASLAIGDLAAAENLVQRMLSGIAGPEAYTRLATLRLYRGKPAEAISALERACSAYRSLGAPAETRAWCEVRLASLQLTNECDPAKAEAGYLRALRILPGYHAATEHLAELRALQGRHEEAVALYKKVLGATGDVTYRVQLASLYAEQGQRQRADRAMRQAVKALRAAANKGIRTHLGLLSQLLVEEESTAAEGLSAAVDDWEHRRDAIAADRLAWAHYKNGNIAEALQFSDRALRSGSQDSGILLRAAIIHDAGKQSSRAAHLLALANSCSISLSAADRAAAEQLGRRLRSP